MIEDIKLRNQNWADDMVMVSAKKRFPCSIDKLTGVTPAVVAFFFLFVFIFVSIVTVAYRGGYVIPHVTIASISALTGAPTNKSITDPNPTPIPFTCPTKSTNITCPPPPQKTSAIDHQHPPPICPEYFRWIHEDLRPWKHSGVTKEMVDKASRLATFRMVVANGRAYVEWYKRSYQTRDVSSIWGLLQLLRRYPGRLPDIDIAFNCDDFPLIKLANHRPPEGPPPLFRYCRDDQTLDIVFPDWSFWGWPEINIKPWEPLVMEMEEENKRTRWVDREPYAYWKGNPAVTGKRRDLLKCRVTDKQDWNARLFVQNWRSESRQGFKNSNVASQCTYRYKIYIEGSAWSVSEKYILACNSPTLFVIPRYYDFFTRGLTPLKHYWPINPWDKCRSIKFAVDWLNNHTDQAETIGRYGSEFIMEEVKMDHVYDYMFHLLNEYSKLMKYKPVIPPKAVEFCSESMACHEEGLKKTMMMGSMVNVSRSSDPCNLPPPFDPEVLKVMLQKKDNVTREVESMAQIGVM